MAHNTFDEPSDKQAYSDLLARNTWGKDPRMGIDGPNVRIHPVMRDIIREVAKRHVEAVETSIGELTTLARLHIEVLDGGYD